MTKDCEEFMQGYTHEAATKIEMEAYVECVQAMQPDSDLAIIFICAFGVAILVALIITAPFGGGSDENPF